MSMFIFTMRGNRYVKIQGDYHSARTRMIERFGHGWRFQYPVGMEDELKAHGYTEVTL